MILVALGSSLAFNRLTPENIITSAVNALEDVCDVIARSRLYNSPAWPDPSDPPFINAVIRVEAALGPEQLLAALHALEAAYGRRRTQRNAPRTLDLDLIDYEGRVWAAQEGGGLILPHPRLAERDFVLAPLAEVAPEWRHPVTGQSAEEMLAKLEAKTAIPIPSKGA